MSASGIFKAKASIAFQTRALVGIAIGQIMLCIAVWVVASMEDDSNRVVSNVMLGLICFIGSFTGIWGATHKDRGHLMFFFIMEIWALSAVTMYMYSGLRAEEAEQLYCEQLNLGKPVNDAVVATEGVSTRDCAKLQSMSRAKIGIAMCFIIATLLLSYLAYRLSEKLQDELEERRGEYKEAGNLDEAPEYMHSPGQVLPAPLEEEDTAMGVTAAEEIPEEIKPEEDEVTQMYPAADGKQEDEGMRQRVTAAEQLAAVDS